MEESASKYSTNVPFVCANMCVDVPSINPQLEDKLAMIKLSGACQTMVNNLHPGVRFWLRGAFLFCLVRMTSDEVGLEAALAI